MELILKSATSGTVKIDDATELLTLAQMVIPPKNQCMNK